MKIACDLARLIKPQLKMGICGQHGAVARSIALCASLELVIISCSPYRIPGERLAAQATILKK